MDKVASSIREFGFKVPVVIDKDGVIVAGHTRVKAAEHLGIKEIPCIVADDLTEEQIKAFRLADNKTAEFADWDFEILAEELADINDIDMSEFGFDIDALDDEEPETEEDETPQEAESRCRRGDLWKLGGCRLLCGDSTNSATIDRLMDGEKTDMVFTDPPYNIASDSKNYAADYSKAMQKLSRAEWDKDFDIMASLNTIYETLSKNASVYICTSHFLAGQIWQWMKEWADHYSYCVWSKPNPMPSLSKRHWTWNTELICYGTRGKHIFNFPKEGHALSTWTINKKNGQSGHPTEKPVEVPATAISHSSNEGSIVLDAFGGSGSTLIACEQLKRRCYMCEIDEHYCDIILQRWETLTGQEAVLLERDEEKNVESQDKKSLH